MVLLSGQSIRKSPPKVEYRLSDKGKSLYPIMEAMCAWGEEKISKGSYPP
ncbi:MAG: winged helix-turn-helix transcriptional regulator [Enterocloster bolteae]